MRAEPQDFQCATPTGLAEQTTHNQTGVDQSQIHVFADDRIGANSISSGRDGKQVSALAHAGDPGRTGIAIGSIRRLTEVLDKFPGSIAVRSAAIGGALVAAFGLGWACSLMLNPHPGAGPARLDHEAVASVGRPDYEKLHVRRNHRIAKSAATLNAAPAQPNKPRFAASPASLRPSSLEPAQMRSEPQGPVLESARETISLPATLSASSDSNPSPRPSPRRSCRVWRAIPSLTPPCSPPSRNWWAPMGRSRSRLSRRTCRGAFATGNSRSLFAIDPFVTRAHVARAIARC